MRTMNKYAVTFSVHTGLIPGMKLMCMISNNLRRTY